MKAFAKPITGILFRITIVVLILAASTTAIAQNRMPAIPADKMTNEQKKALEEFLAARGTPTGPWIALLRSPDLINRARGLSDYLRFKSVLPPRLSEFVILMTARQYTQQYEWNAHYQLAMTGGLKPDVAKAIAEGRRPEHMAEDEEILYDFCMELHHNKSVSDATYARAVSKFGEQGLVDTVSLTGYYVMISMILNTVRTPLPEGVAPALSAFPW
jgi:4-carboxymuconolactone decarboxylase